MATQAAVSHNPSPQESGNLGLFRSDFRRALTAWCRAKDALRKSMRHEDFQSFVRPMYLLANFAGHLLIALPHNHRVVERARNFRPNLAAFVEREGYHLAGFTGYPSDDQLLQLADHPSFAPFIQIISRGRIRKLKQRFAAEDARDTTRFRGVA